MPISRKRLAEIAAIDTIDTTDLPEMGEDFFKTARLVMPAGGGKQAVSLRVDEDVVTWFRAQGKGHLSRMNAVLRAYMLAQKGD
jgi:uncharacterized protein (DUF4415 family)